MTKKSLNALLLEKVGEAPRLITQRFVAGKLGEHGIVDEQLARAITEHLIDHNETEFVWGDEKYQDVDLDFTDDDVHKILAAIERFSSEGVKELVENTLEKGAVDIVQRLEKQWPEQAINERSQVEYFADRLQLRWGKALDPLRMLMTASREIGAVYHDKLKRSKAKSGVAQRSAISIIHMRACQTTLEIMTLLEHGLADGAFARWRTLYELSVVAFMVERFGDDLAQRYFDHDAIAAKESLDNQLRLATLRPGPPVPVAAQKHVNERHDEAVQRYGKTFSTPYGWAAEALGKKRPTFQNLEEAVDWDCLPQIYKESSLKVHAGITGTLWNLGHLSEQPAVLSGASNAGLETPIVNAAYSLVRITALLFGKAQKLEDQIQMRALLKLREKVEVEANKAARKLWNDERKLSR